MNIQDNFVKPNDPVLIKKAAQVPLDKITSDEIKVDIEQMLKVAFGEQTDRQKPLLVGLAAPQVGISKRIILVDLKASGVGQIGDLRVYINPEITWSSAETNDWYEGCYSTSHVCGIVKRPTQIKIKAFNQAGQEIEEAYEGYTARIFQHEIDHLNGIEFVTHITDDQNLHWVEDDQFPEYRNNEGWRNWKIKCSREKWAEIKGIKKHD